MEEYDIKKGHFINEEKLFELLKSTFGNAEKEGNRCKSTYGAMQSISAWLKDKNTLCIEIETNPSVDRTVALDTIKKRNLFLEAATGFTAKERIKRLQKKG